MRGRLAKKVYDRDYRYKPMSAGIPTSIRKWILRAWRRSGYRSVRVSLFHRLNKRERCLLGYSPRRRNCNATEAEVWANRSLYIRNPVLSKMTTRVGTYRNNAKTRAATNHVPTDEPLIR